MTLNPNDFPCVEDYFSKFKTLGLLLKDCKIDIKDDRCIFVILVKLNSAYFVFVVDDCSYVTHSPAYKTERNPLRGVCGSYLRQSWNVEMASSL
jgi:hypothetical protein